MPLNHSASKAAFKQNVRAEMAARPQKQALAIAFRVQRDASKKAGGGEVPFTSRSMAKQMEHAGMIHSPVAGRTDKLPMGVAPNSYVLPADAVSALGQGNSMAGANALNKLFKTAPGGASMPHPRGGAGLMKIKTAGMMNGRRGFADGGATEPVDIIAAGGEYVVAPEIVEQLGGGDMKRGHDILDLMVKQIRAKTIKTLKRLPGPKAG